MANKKPKVLLIGWDAADWKMINPLLDKGLMPALESLIDTGTMANLKTLNPPLSPMLWTSIATGMRPYKHGIHGFVEVEDEKVRPVYVNSRKVKAIWNILMQKGYSVNKVAWWPSHPTEPVNGVSVSNLFHLANSALGGEWPLPERSVHPPEMRAIIEKCRVHPHELTEAHLLPFIPNAARLDQRVPRNQLFLNHLRKVIAEASSVHAASTYILENEEWDFFALYQDAIDHFAHAFMKYHPPKQAFVSQDDFDMWSEVMNGAYIFHDMMLGRLLDFVDNNTYVFLVSDHGFHNDHLRLKNLIKAPAGPAEEHSPYGVLVAKGPGIKKDENIFGATLLDVTPTILHALRIPVGKDMDGKVLTQAFEEERAIEQIPSWEDVEGNSGQLAEDVESGNEGLAMALERLEELGYISNINPEKGEANTEQVILENEYYLAQSYLDGGKVEEAALILQRIHEAKPEEYRYVIPLVHCYLVLRLPERAEPLIELLENDKRNFSLLVAMQKGRLELVRKDFRQALQYYKEAETLKPDNLAMLSQLGKVFGDLEKWRLSEKYYQKVLKSDKYNAEAMVGAGLAKMRLKRLDDALDQFLESISLNFENAAAHHFMGECLYRMKMHKEAAQALEISLRIQPGLRRSYIWLKKIYSKAIPDALRLEQVEAALNEEGRKELIIVSGLPRSGTSMMMSMLSKGGLEIVSDSKREADESNPKGYYELEQVKTLHKDKKFLDDIPEGHVLKVISHQLLKLPNDLHYKVIFMRRDLSEVMQSQHKMLERDGKTDGKTYSLSIEENFRRNLKNVELRTSYRGNFEILYLDFKEVHASPYESAIKVEEFLGKKMNTKAMAGAVEPSLHRERIV